MSLARLKAILQITSAKLDEKENDDFVISQMKYLIQCLNAHEATADVDRDERTRLSFKCLINLCSTPARDQLFLNTFESELARVEFVKHLKNIWLSSIGEDKEEGHLAFDLLCNLTHDTNWSSIVVQDNSETLLDLTFQSDRMLTNSLPLLLNLTSQSKIRKLLNTLAQFRSRLIGKLSSPDDDDVRQTLLVVGVLKNCFFDDTYHLLWLSPQSQLLEGLLKPLCGPEDEIDDEDRQKLPAGLKQIVGRPLAKRCESNAVKQLICEALFQLCSTSDGRARLRDCGVYFVLRELHKFESCKFDSRNRHSTMDASVRSQTNELVYKIEQVVDQLICQEEERDPDSVAHSLRTIDVDPETAAQLDRAKAEFLCAG